MDSRLRTIVHALGNSLTVARGATELAKQKLEAEHPARREVDTAIAAVDEACELTRELRDLTAQR